MTPKEREAFYDREVAPVLLALAKQCEANGLSFVASVEYGPNETGRTMSLQADAGINIRMAYWAGAACGNADGLIIAMLRHAREHGHNSAYLAMLDRKA